MAKRLNYTIGVDADTSKFEASLNDAFSRLNKIGSQINFTTELKKGSQAALELSSHLDKAFNKETGKLDLSTFNQNLAKSGKTLTDYANDLISIGPTGEQAFLKVANAITQAELPLKRTNKLFDQLWVTMKNTMRWQLTSSVLHGFVGTLEQAYGYAKNLNRSLNEIRIVSEKSADDMSKFAEQANKAAKALSTTTVDYTDASLIYYQQGLTDQEVLDRTETTIKMANVAGTTAEQASQQLTAVWNNFYDGNQSLEHYADVMVKLGAATASSSDEISEGIEKFAAVANTVGLSYEYAASALATVTAQTRESASVVGTAFRTLFSRIQGLQQGDTLDDGTTLNKYSTALAKVGVQIKDTSGELKGMDQILDDLGSRWNSLAQDQKIALAETVAGVRQWTQLIALMDNWDFFKENLALAQEADGALNQQADIYAESWEAARDRTKAAAEDIYDSLINPDFFIGVDNVFTPIMSRIADVIDSLGGLQGVLALVALGMNKVYGDKIAQSMRDMAVTLGVITGKEGERARQLQAEATELVDNLSITYAANEAEAMRLNVLKQEVILQGEINAKYDQFDEQQKSILADEQYKLNILKQQYLATVDRINALQNSSHELHDDMSTSLRDDNKDWQTDAWTEIEAYNEKYKSLTKNPYKITVDIDNKSNIDKTFENIIDNIDTLTKKQASLKLVTTQFDNLKKSTNLTDDAMKKLISNYDSSIDVASMDSAELEAKLEELKQEALQSNEAIRALAKALELMGANPQVINRYIAQIRSLNENLVQSENQVESLNNQMDKMNEGMRTGFNVQKDWADILVQAGTTISQVSMTVNGLSSLFETLNEVFENDIDAVSAFTKILGSLGQVAPGLAILIRRVTSESAKNAIQFLATGAAAGEGAAGVATLGTAFYSLLPIVGLVAVGLWGLVAVFQLLNPTADKVRETIQKATEAYEEETSTLESLNSELETTKNKIDELNKQNTLSIVEQEELEKLKNQEKSLERQIQLQKQLATAAQKAQAAKIEQNYEQSTKDIIEGPKGLALFGAANPEDWREQNLDGVEKGTDEYYDILGEYATLVERNRQIIAEWISENSEAIQKAEDNYSAYVNAIESGAIDYDSDVLAEMQERLAEIRKNMYYSESEYEQVVIEPVLDDEAVKQVSSKLYNALANGDIADAVGFISSSIKDELLYAGISVDDFLTYLNNKVDNTKKAVQDKFSDFNFNKLTGKDWEILATVNLDNFDNIEELQKFLDDYKNNNINVEVTGIDELKEVLDLINSGQDALEKALKSYKEQGYLTMDQVQELIDADESYAQYITKVGDAYKLTNQSLQDFLTSEDEEEELLDATLNAMKSKSAANTEYVSSWINMWDAIVDKTKEVDAIDTYNFADQNDLDNFRGWTEVLSNNAKAYQDGTKTAEQYFTTIDRRIGQIGDKFHDLNKEVKSNVKETDLYEATLAAATGSISNGLIDLNKRFRSGSINMDQYYKGTLAGTKALISAQSALYEELEKGADGSWKLKDGISKLTVGAQRYDEVTKAMSELNTWEEQSKQAESMVGLVDVLTDHYDYLSQYAQNGSGVFTIENNFDTTAKEYQDMCNDMGKALSGLEEDNNEAYKSLLEGIQAQGIELKNGLNTSAEELQQMMQEDSKVTAAALNASVLSVGTSVSSMAQGAGQILNALGDLISNFDYTINFTPEFVDTGDTSGITDVIAAAISGKWSSVKLPQIKLGITGSGGDSVENLSTALKNTASFLAEEAWGKTRTGYNAFGDKDLDSGILNPDDIETDNLRDKTKKSGSKGKTYDTEDRKDPKEAEDRYHNINRALERQEDLLEDLDNATDRAWGTEALDGYEKKLKALKDQQQLYNTKLKDAEGYLYGIKGKREGDLEVVQKYFKEAQIGANGEITNYEELLQKNLKLYNAAVDRYNLAVKGKTLTEEQHTALKNQLDTEKKLFDKRQDALKQYESTIDTIRELNDNLEENARAQADLKLTEIKTKMEIVLDIKSMKDTVRDLSKEISEMFGDALTHGIESAELSMKSAQAEAALLPSYQEEWDSLKELYNSTTDEADRKSIMDEIKSLQSNIANSAKAIADWVNSIEDIIPDAISAASERFSAFTDQLEHNTSVLDTIKELYTLQGVTYKTAAGFNRLQRNSQEKLNAQVASAELQKGWYNEAAKRLQEAQEKLDSLGRNETDLRYDTYKKARDAYLEEFNQAQEAYLSSAKEAMETAQDMYVQQIERATYLFGQAVSNNVGLDLLQDKYDHYIESEERYFDKVNEAYQVASWYNKLQQDIDDTTNVAYKNRLKALQEEIDKRKEGNKLSQYDLDILNAKYQLLQAQQALEDAQNAKNQIQLVRDSQGNWNYQYTANQDDIAKAEQDVLDAQNNWYNIAKDQTKQVAGEIVSMWQECTDAVEQLYKDLANGDISEEEYLKKKEEIEQYYTEKAKYLEEEKTQAIKDMNEAGYEELKNIAEKNGETVKEFENVYAKELESMTDSNKNFADMLDKYLQQCDDKFNNYKDTVKQVASDTGTTLGNLAEETDKVSEATDQVKQRGDEAKYTLWEMADAASSAAEKYLDLANSMWATVRAMQTLTGAQANFATSKGTKAYDENTDYTSMIIQGLVNGYISYGDDTYNSLIKQLQDKAGEGANLDLDQFKSYKKGDTPSGWAAGRYNTEEEWRKNLENLKKNYGLDTGGYTGLFDDAKLAFLHQKELVLNQSDTENILAAVQAVRTIGTDLFKSIEKSLDGNAIAAMTLMSQKLNPVATIPIQDSIEQTVHIDKVEFPNVTSRTEIEEAFISLTNDAAQWARRKT